MEMSEAWWSEKRKPKVSGSQSRVNIQWRFPTSSPAPRRSCLEYKLATSCFLWMKFRSKTSTEVKLSSSWHLAARIQFLWSSTMQSSEAREQLVFHQRTQTVFRNAMFAAWSAFATSTADTKTLTDLDSSLVKNLRHQIMTERSFSPSLKTFFRKKKFHEYKGDSSAEEGPVLLAAQDQRAQKRFRCGKRCREKWSALISKI